MAASSPRLLLPEGTILRERATGSGRDGLIRLLPAAASSPTTNVLPTGSLTLSSFPISLVNWKHEHPSLCLCARMPAGGLSNALGCTSMIVSAASGGLCLPASRDRRGTGPPPFESVFSSLASVGSASVVFLASVFRLCHSPSLARSLPHGTPCPFEVLGNVRHAWPA